ncbi:MAG: hypothetical protein H6700_07135 [Myxococcales bacterium]|nr:hypothetical protein [Myxococcales bacterium]MCB9520599.1 hypothetical protein [Myxococcales bacterium]MCB9531522.1 hypothetical protein [Myxococcales bacterium]
MIATPPPLWPASVVAVAAVVGVVAVGSGGRSAPAPPAPPPLAEPTLPAIRMFHPDGVASAVARTGTRFEPPWTREPARGPVWTRGFSPQPLDAWEASGEHDGWSLWQPAGRAEARPTPFDLADAVRGARVWVESTAGELRECDRWVFGRWYCGPDTWNTVGVADVTISGRAESCIWAHPIADSDLHILFPAVPQGNLAARAAIADVGVASDVEGDVRYDVLVDGQVVATRSHAQRAGFISFRVSVREAEREVEPPVERGESDERTEGVDRPHVDAAPQRDAGEPEGDSEPSALAEPDQAANDERTPLAEATEETPPRAVPLEIVVHGDVVAQRHFCFTGSVRAAPRPRPRHTTAPP